MTRRAAAHMSALIGLGIASLGFGFTLACAAAEKA